MEAILRKSDGWEKEVDDAPNMDIHYVLETPLTTIEFEHQGEFKQALPVFIQVVERATNRR